MNEVNSAFGYWTNVAPAALQEEQSAADLPA
jgi:hypothetical protein